MRAAGLKTDPRPAGTTKEGPMTRRLLCTAVAGFAALALAAAPAVADDVIHRGADGWKTVASTYSTFARDPIPAGFFCPGSPPFTGRVDLRGVPIAAEPAGALDGRDTLIGRLDDAVFDAEGVARTRIALIALNLESVEPIDTGCGLFDVRVVLDDEQPTTEMTIVRRAAGGGTFEAPLALNTRVIFTPVAGGESLVVERRIDLGPGSNSVWIESRRPDEPNVARVDTDGDGVPDREVALGSNFRPGIALAATSPQISRTECGVSCHCTVGSTDPNEPNSHCDHLHCVEVNCPGPTPAY
jgi:hypothetical protein